jgi:hypothetical protein
MAYLTTLHDLIKELETHSSIIGSMGLAQQLQDCPLTNDLRVFANQDGEKALVRFALDRLVELQLITVADAEITRTVNYCTHGTYRQVQPPKKYLPFPVIILDSQLKTTLPARFS